MLLKTKKSKLIVVIAVVFGVTFLYFLKCSLPFEVFLVVVSIMVTLGAGLAPVYIELYKIKNAVVTPVTLGTSLSASIDSIVAFSDAYSYASIKTATTTKISEGSGYVREIRVLGGVLGNVAVYDGTPDSGSEIVPTVLPERGQVLKKDCIFASGLTIVTEADTIITVSYRSRI